MKELKAQIFMWAITVFPTTTLHAAFSLRKVEFIRVTAKSADILVCIKINKKI